MNLIPKQKKIAGWEKVKIKECHEPLVKLNGYDESSIIVKADYYNQGLSHSSKELFIRQQVAEKLVKAAQYLPNGYKFLVWDAWRPLALQQALFDAYYQILKEKNPTLADEKLLILTKKYVSLPSDSAIAPSPHFTGGAVDLTIIDELGIQLIMGTEFDYFGKKAETTYFEQLKSTKAIDIEIINNRRILYNSMVTVGFTNYPEEWWHYDYGNQFWGKMSDKAAFYGKIIE